MPIRRFSVLVHNRKNENITNFNGIEDAVGKSVRDAAADFASNDGPRLRVSKNSRDCGFHLKGESNAQTFGATLVENNRIFKF